MTQILVTKPGCLSVDDRNLLRDSGVVAIEADDPSAVKLITTEGAEISGSDMLFAAMSALSKSGAGHTYFVNMLTTLLTEQRDAS